MEKKCRIQTSVILVRHPLNQPLNKRDMVQMQDNDDDVVCVEAEFSYDDTVFNNCLQEEMEEGMWLGVLDNPSVPAPMEQPPRVLENPSAPASMEQSPGRYKRYERNRSKKTLKQHEVTSSVNADGSKTPGDEHEKENTETASGVNAEAGENAKAAGIDCQKGSKKKRKSANMEPNSSEMLPSTVGGQEARENARAAGIHCQKGDKKKRKSVNMEPNSSEMSVGGQLRPNIHGMLNLGTKRLWLDDEKLEEVHKLVSDDCKDQVILTFKEISVNGSELERSLQGSETARDLIIVLKKCLDGQLIKNPKNSDTKLKRILVSPLNKDDQDLVTKIQDAVHKRRSPFRPISLSNTIIYCPVFFSGEWIVICFMLIDQPYEIHVFCPRKSLSTGVKDFCFSLGHNLNEAFEICGYNKVEFPKFGFNDS